MTDASWSTVPDLQGRHVHLAPLQAAHARALGAAAAEGGLSQLAYTWVPTPEEAHEYVEAALQAHAHGESLPFVVLDDGGQVVGTTRLYRIDARVPRVTIGYTWYARRVQRTALNTEAKRLLLAYCFEVRGCASVAFETSHLNTRSQAAIERLGAKRDGVLRHHMRHRDGSLRDTYAYSIIASEWPGIRARLDARLAETGHA